MIWLRVKRANKNRKLGFGFFTTARFLLGHLIISVSSSVRLLRVVKKSLSMLKFTKSKYIPPVENDYIGYV